MDFLSTDIIFSFLTLSMLEIVLGIDNLIFIALVVQNLPKNMQAKVRLFGLTLALVIRVLMLAGAVWIMKLTKPFFSVFDIAFSVKDLLLLAGGLFLITKATMEMHVEVAGIEQEHHVKARSKYMSAIIQVVIIDFVFSFDSIITAVGISQNLPVMVGAVVVSMIVMLLASGYISHFLHEHPTFKVLALSFILMIGMLLVAEGLHYHVERAYVYFAFVFSGFVEAVNTIAAKKRRKRQAPEVKL